MGPGPYVPPAERVRPWWGFGDVLLWYFVARYLSALITPTLATRLGYPLDVEVGPGSTMGEVMGRVTAGQSPAVTAAFVDMPLWLRQGVFQLPLWACFIGGSIYATTRKGFGPVRDLKLRLRPIDVPVGLAVGLAAQFLLNPLLYRILYVFTGDLDASAAARNLTAKATSPAAVVFLFVTVGLVAPFAEELFFRGLALRSLHRRFGSVWAVVLSSAMFALVHENPVLFVGLFPLAVILAVLVERFDRLGPALTTHVTYNLATAIVLVAGVELPW
jgi:membrane protease YdiL (CAAX protease family)